jgi:hypothetical protein
MSEQQQEVNPAKQVKERQELGFASKTMFMCSIPQLQPKNPDGSFVLTWERKNGNTTLGLTANPKFGLPAGKDKLFAHWLKTHSVMQDSPIIYFKDGTSILEEMGLDPKGNNKIWLNGVINRFTHTVMSYEDGNKFKGGNFEGSLIIKGMNGYFDKKSYNPNQRSFFVLGDLIFKVPGVPIDLNTLRLIGRSWFAMDFYTFLNYRLWCETKNLTQDDISKLKPIRIPMDAYRMQSGVPETRADRFFRRDLKEACKRLEEIGTEFKPYLDKNDVITVPVVKPTYILTSKNQEVMRSFHEAFERVKNSSA